MTGRYPPVRHDTVYQPTLAQARALAGSGNLVPIYREINADMETPVSAYLKVARPPYSFLLESVEGGERLGRYSFIGTEPQQVIITGPGQPQGDVDPLRAVQEMLARYRLAGVPPMGRFNGGAVGYLAYEASRHFERLPSPEHDALDLPVSVFMLTTTFLVFDHLRHKVRVVSHAFLDDDPGRAYVEAVARIEALVARLRQPVSSPPAAPATPSAHPAEVASNISRAQYEETVRLLKRYIYEGDVIQVVPSQRLSRATSAHPFQVYRALRAINPSPYMYYLDLNGFQIVGASPELLVQVIGGTVATHPIAGTRPRGADAEEDAALARELASDEKERAEHTMLLDLGRNDVGRVSVPGSVRVTELMEIERYSHVMHLVSHVVGKLKPELSCYDALRACFPAGTVSGAPKIRAMQLIAEVEPDRRGPYAGAVGYFDLTGNMDTAIAIRTLVMKDGMAYAQAGGGVVFDSKPETEYEETLHKASALLRAIEQAEAGE